MSVLRLIMTGLTILSAWNYRISTVMYLAHLHFVAVFPRWVLSSQEQSQIGVYKAAVQPNLHSLSGLPQQKNYWSDNDVLDAFLKFSYYASFATVKKMAYCSA